MPSDHSIHWRIFFRSRQLSIVGSIVLVCVGFGYCAQRDVEQDPIVNSIRARDPQTGEGLVEVIRNLLDIGRPDEAVRYIERLGKLPLDADGWFSLLRQAGSDFTYRLATDGKLQPIGRTVANQMLDAANQVANDPARLEQLTKLISNPDIRIRSAALDDLRSLGEPGGAALLNALADPARAADRPFLRRALVEFGSGAIGPLTGGIRANQSLMQREAIGVAGSYLSSDLVALLLRPAFQAKSAASQTEATENELRAAATAALKQLLPQSPTALDARELLQAKIRHYLSPASLDREVTQPRERSLYRLNPETGKLVKLTRSADVIDRMLAAEFAEDLLHIAPGDRTVEIEYVLALLEATKYARGFEIPVWHTPALTAVERLGGEALGSVLDAALQRNLNGAAMAACEALGHVPEDSAPAAVRWEPLVRAVNSPDVRVRFAACQALMELQPQQAFPGCSDVLRTMVELASGHGRPKVLVAVPRINEAELVAATLDKLGFQAEPVTGARELLETATTDPDVQLILLSDRMNPGPAEILTQLRNHPKSRRTPVVLMYESQETVLAQRGGSDRQDIVVHLVVDGRKFVDYDRWVQAYVNSPIADLHPLLLVVPPGNTATALGLSTQRGHVRFLEMKEDAELVSTDFLELVREKFRLDRAPVCLLVQPVSSSTPRTEVALSLIVNPAEWPAWAQWTRVLHDNPVTSVVDVVLITAREVKRFQALEQQVVGESRTIPAGDIEFLFQLVVEAISTERALWTAYLDPAAQQRAEALADTFERVVSAPATLDARLLARQVEQIRAWRHEDRASLPLQQVMGAQAAEWLQQISADPNRYPFWDLAQLDQAVVAMARTARVTPAVCQILGQLGTPQAQAQLLLLVERQQLPLAVRQAAAAAFQTAVERHGIFLTSEQLHRQYERYNSSATLPAEVQAMYAAILDTLEAETQISK